VTKAKDAGLTLPQQEPVVAQCRALVAAFAKVGLVALIDEATGYQADRARDALAQILEAFVEKELCSWSKTFPDEYYSELCRLRGISVDDFSTKKHPVLGQLTNDIVYERLAPGLLDELRRVNPKTEKGHRKAKHHQWLTRTVGHPKLAMHLGRVVMLMEMCESFEDFKDRIDQHMPRFKDNMAFTFMEKMPRRRLPQKAAAVVEPAVRSQQGTMFDPPALP
jgi:hypothetical protein